MKQVFITLFIFLAQSLAYGADESGFVLNGKGTRSAMFIELYTCELYLPAPSRDPQEILATDQPVLVKLNVHGDPPGSLPTDWSAVLKSELSDKLFDKVKRKYRDLEQGDTVAITYSRDLQGTQVVVNDQLLFTDPGRSLLEAILGQWLGESPVSDKLKQALLSAGQEA